MEPRELREAVVRCIATLDDPVMEVRATPLRALGVLLEHVVRERLDDKELGESLDGLSIRRVSSDGVRTLDIVGVFYTLMPGARGKIGNQRLPMEAHLSLEPGAVSTLGIGGRDSLFDQSLSERRFQRLLEAPWPHSLELRLG